MSGKNLTWTSDLDGFIGQGQSFSSKELSEGFHIIILRAIDSGGYEGGDSVFITVGNPKIPQFIEELEPNKPKLKKSKLEKPKTEKPKIEKETVPSLELLFVPPFGSFEDLKGRALNANPKDFVVAVYIMKDIVWWTKPSKDSQTTKIGDDGKWVCDITTADGDEVAIKIAAYLIPTDYKPPLALGDFRFPKELERKSLAKIEVTRRIRPDNPIDSQPVPLQPSPDFQLNVAIKTSDLQRISTDITSDLPQRKPGTSQNSQQQPMTQPSQTNEGTAPVLTYDLSNEALQPPTNINRLAPNEPVATRAKQIAVTVNGVQITEGQVDKMLEPQLAWMARQNRPPEYMEQVKKTLRQQALERMIIEQLIDEKARQANIVVTDEEIVSYIREILYKQNPPMSVEDFKKNLEDLGESFDDAKKQMQKGLILQKLLGTQVGNIAEADAKEYYSENQDQHKTPEQIRASHILIKPDTSISGTDLNQAKTKARAKAEGLLEQVKAGADFAELARANSDCPSSKNGGDLGFFGRGRMVLPFEKAAFELETGQVSDIVETAFGYHIIKVTERKNTSTQAFEQVKDNIIKQLTKEKQRELAVQYIEALKQQARIVYP